MRRMFQVSVIIAMLVTAVSADARQATTVEIDFPGAAAVEAGMSDPKPVDPDPQGRRRASIVVPPNDRGTIYAMRRADGTVVVRLVSQGDPAPAGFTNAGRYSAGQSITFDTTALTITQATGTNAMDDARGTNRFNVGLRFGLGSGSLLDAVDENCADLIDEFGLTCTGDDRGFTWTAGADARVYLTDKFDVTLRAGLTRTPEFRIDASGSIEGFQISSVGTGRGTLWHFGGEFGVVPAPRWRLYGGGGLSPFTFDSDNTVSVFDQIEQDEQSNSGLGRTAYFGIERSITRHLSLYGEAGRTWMKDDDVSGEDEAFDEKFSAWIIGMRWSFQALRGWR